MPQENVTARIGSDFSKELEFIKRERMRIGLDKARKSTKKLTNLLVKHRDWNKIKEDTIRYNFNNGHKSNETNKER